MRDFDGRNQRDADLFYADLIGVPRQRGRPAASPGTASISSARPSLSPDAGRLFDSVVHHGMSPGAILGSEGEEAGRDWEAIARPGSATPPAHLPQGALIARRALGDARLGFLQVLGDDVQVHELYERDGRIRRDVLVLSLREPPDDRGEAREDTQFAEDADSRSADSALDEAPLQIDPAYNTDDQTVPPVWKLSDRIRDLVTKPQNDRPNRDLLELAATRQLRTALLYEQVSMAYRITAATSQSAVLVLYVVLFPGEGRDNTGMKDLNDNVLGYNRHNEYIRLRQQQIRTIFNAPFTVVGQDYKTALILAKLPDTKNAVKDNRMLFDQRLRKLDAALRDELLKLLRLAEKEPRYKDKAEELRKLLEKKPDYRFDIYYGASVRTLAVARIA